MRINTNVAAMNTYSRLTAANTAKSNSLAKLSSGEHIQPFDSCKYRKIKLIGKTFIRFAYQQGRR